MDLVNKLKPGYLTNANYTYEAEGAFNHEGKLVSVQIVNNNPSVATDGRVLVLQHNRTDGVRGRSSRRMWQVNDVGRIRQTSSGIVGVGWMG